MTSAVRKWAPWGLLLAVALAVLIVGTQRGGGTPSLDSRVQHISSEVRCPVCQGETVAQSQAAPSVQIRNEIRTDLQKGQSEGQILSSLVAAYGPGILEKPQAKGISLFVWVVPVIAVAVGAAGLFALLRRWKWAGGTPSDRPDRPGETAEETDEAEEVVPVLASVGGPAPAGPAVPTSATSTTTAPVPAQQTRPRRSRRKTVLACAGVVLVAGGASWAVAASSGTRLPGETITGQNLGTQAEAAALQAAQTDENRNDVFGAIKEYQKVLNSDPTQVEALSGEGWLLAQTGQPTLLKQGLTMLVRAEQAQPDYPAAHLYRGLALLGESDYTDSVPELQWYLAHNPDPQVAPQVQKALSEAQSKAAAQPPASPTPPG